MPRDVSEPKTIGERMTTEQLAASAYRAWHGMLRPLKDEDKVLEPLPWAMTPMTERAAWLKVATEAEAIIEEMTGKPAREIGHRLHDLFVGGAETRKTVYAELVWEAVARHLFALFEEDDIEDLGALEQSWRGWADKRLQFEEKQP